MDLSKLPRRSQTSTPPNDPNAVPGTPYAGGEPVAYSSSPRYRSYRDEDEGQLNFLDIFLAVGMGLLFVFLGSHYGKHLLGNKEAYPEIAGTGYVWTAPHPKAGQPILPQELSPENKAAYDQRIVGRRMAIISDSSMFLFGAALALAGLLGIAGHLWFLPPVVRQAVAGLGLVATLAGIAYALWAVVAMMGTGIIPHMTMVAILVGGVSLFMQAGALRSLVGASADAGHSPTRAFADERVAAWPAAARPDVAAATTASPERVVHHRFAHQVLRRQVFDDPARVIGTLQGPGGRKYLLDLWEATCHAAGVDPAAVPPTGLESEMTQVGPYSAAVVTMPPARARGEAQLVGIVLRSYVRQDGAVIERSPLVLYYALELAADASAGGPPAATALCEWQGGDHVKFADAVASEFAAFREAMRQKVQFRQDAEDRAGSLA